mgnify:FL=1
MKICGLCKKKKKLENFNFKNKTKNIRNARCTECTRQSIRNHYNAHTDYYLKKAKLRNQRLRIEVKKYIYEYLSEHHCVDCGESDIIVLEFDHIKDKTKDVSLLARNATVKIIREEINKCEVRCANCHRRKTALRAG